MGTLKPFAPEKLVIGVLSSLPSSWEDVFSDLERLFGPSDYRSAGIPFTFTRYYDAEMGVPIERRFYSCRDLVDPERLADVKLRTNALEDGYRQAARRRVNLDPGLLSLSRVALATTKEAAHRIPLRRGIYAEVTLIFEKGGFRPLPWTYPDYRTDRYREIFREIRALYKAAIQDR
jgi:hypothetical protein